MHSKINRFFKEGYGVEVKNSSPFLLQYKNGKQKLKKMLGGQKEVVRNVDLIADDSYIIKKMTDILEKYEINEKFIGNFTTKEISYNKTYSKKLIQGKTFQKGMRTSKIIASFLSNSIDKFYNDYSMLIQDIRIQGQIVITIDLLEMMTASMNDNNWSSCLNLDNGVYRGGIYSYVMDNWTIMAYLRSSKIDMNGIKVDNKQWRQFIHLNLERGQALFSKNYPYHSKKLSLEVRSIVEELLSSYMDKPDSWKVVRDIDIIKGAVKDVGETFDFNDVLLSSGDDNIVAIYNKYGEMDLEFEIGEKYVLCPTCGEKNIASEEMIICDDCDSMVKCNSCKEYDWKTKIVDGVCYDCLG